jgi:hypothetical protein
VRMQAHEAAVKLRERAPRHRHGLSH